jgi:hypothetical protein
MKPVIRVPHQGTGKFGNEFFWYLFGKTYARRHGLKLEVNPWMGNGLFATDDPAPGADALPCIYEKSEHGVDDTVIPHAPPFGNVSFIGYFQYHTSYYAPDQEYLRGLFPPRPEIAAPVERGWKRLRERGRTAVVIHVRRRDYGFLYHYRTPTQWYLDLLARIWPQLDRPFLYVASDDLEAVIGDFARYAPVSAADLGPPLPAHDFYRDFHALRNADVLLIPNSTFSFAAALLNGGLQASYRSLLPARGFVPFDPWDSKPLEQGWEAHVERYPLLREIWKPMPGWKRWLKWIRFHFRKTMYDLGIFRADGRPPAARRAPWRPLHPAA